MGIVMNLTLEQIANLEKLATYLEKLPPDYGEFDMSSFARIGQSAIYKPEVLKPAAIGYQCGAVCCAVGHGPAAGIPLAPNETWYDYAARAFGAGGDVDDHGRLWEWCFDSGWECIDNTATGAAWRIRWALQNDGPPGWFEYVETIDQNEYEKLRRDEA